jgi:hypothetical protein
MQNKERKWQYRLWGANAVLLVIILLVVYFIRGADVSVNIIRTSIAAFFLLVLPGIPWAVIFLNKFPQKRFLFLPFSFTFTLICYLPVVFAGYYFTLKTGDVFTLLGFTCAIVFLSGLFALKKGYARRQQSCHQDNSREIWIFHGLTALLIVLFGILALSGVLLKGGDGWLHMSIIRKFLDRGRITLASPFFEELQLDTNYGYCIWHVVLAFLSKLTGLAPDCVWFSVYPLLLFLSGYSLFGFGLYLFKKYQFAFVYLLAHIWALNRFAGNLAGLRILQYPYLVAPLIVLPLAWIFYFEFLRREKKSFGIITILICLLVFFIHKLTFMGFFIFFTLFSLISALFYRGTLKKRLKPVLIVLIMAAILGVFLFLVKPSPVTNPFHFGFAAKEVIRWGEWGITVKPKVALFRAGWMVYHRKATWIPILSLALSPLLLWRLWWTKKRKAFNPLAVYCASGLLIIPLIMLNPFIGKLYVEKFTNQALVRLYCVIPHYAALLACAMILLQLFRIKVKSNLGIKLVEVIPSGILIIVMIAFLFQNFPVFVKAMIKPSLYESLQRSDPMSQVLTDFDRIEETPSVVCAQYLKGHYVTALTKHYVVQAPPSLTSPSMRDYRERNEAREKILSSETSPEERAYFIEKYHVKFLLIDYNSFKEYDPESFEKIFSQGAVKARPAIHYGKVYLYALSIF